MQSDYTINNNSRAGVVRLRFSVLIFIIASILLLCGRIQYGSFTQKGLTTGLVFLWFLIAWLENPHAMINAMTTKPSVLIWLSIFVRLLLLLISPYGMANSFEYTFVRIAMIMPLIAFLYYSQILDYREQKKLLIETLVVWFIVIVLIIRYIGFDLSIARIISAGNMSRGYFGSLLDIVIGTACIIVALFGTRFRVTKLKLRKKIILCSIILSVFFLIVGYFTQSFITLFLGGIVIIYELVIPNKEERSTKVLLLGFLALLLVILALTNLKEIGNFMISISSKFGGSIFETKFKEIGNTLIYGEAVGDLGIRVKHLTTSVDAFIKNPILGNAPIYGFTTEHALVGRHSGVDILARFGVAGALPAILGYWLYLKWCIIVSNRYLTKAVLFLVATYMVLAGWEHVEGIYAFAFIAPMIAYIVMKGDNLEES